MAISKETTASNQATAPAAGATILRVWLDRLSRYWILIALVILVAVSAVLSHSFLTWGNIVNIFRQASINGLLSVGLTFTILSGGVDISNGAMVEAIGMMYAMANGFPLIVAVLFALVAGAVLGRINGLLTNHWRIEPFLATLGMWVFLDGLSLWMGKGMQILIKGPSPLKFFGQGYLGAIPVPVVIFLGVAVAAHLVLSRTVFGRSLYAIGGNEHAAYLSGINVRAYRNAAYVISGVLSAVAGIVMVGRLGLADPTIGYGLALDSVAATVVGGVRLGGGRGYIWGTVAGVLLLAVINNLFNLMNLSSYIQLMAKGMIIVAAVGFGRKKGA